MLTWRTVARPVLFGKTGKRVIEQRDQALLTYSPKSLYITVRLLRIRLGKRALNYASLIWTALQVSILLILGVTKCIVPITLWPTVKRGNYKKIDREVWQSSKRRTWHLTVQIPTPKVKPSNMTDEEWAKNYIAIGRSADAFRRNTAGTVEEGISSKTNTEQMRLLYPPLQLCQAGTTPATTTAPL